MSQSICIYEAVAKSEAELPFEVQKFLCEYSLKDSCQGESILVTLAKRNDLSPFAKKTLEESSSVAVFRAWVSRPDFSLEEKRAVILKEKRSRILSAFAMDPATPTELLDLLQEKLTANIASNVLKNPNCSDELFKKAFEELDKTGKVPSLPTRQALQESKSHLHEEFALSCNEGMGLFLFSSPLLSEKAQLRLAAFIAPVVQGYQEKSNMSVYFQPKTTTEEHVALESLLAALDNKFLHAKTAKFFLKALTGFKHDLTLCLNGQEKLSSPKDTLLKKAELSKGEDLEEVIKELKELHKLRSAIQCQASNFLKDELEALFQNEGLAPYLLESLIKSVPCPKVRNLAILRFRKGDEKDFAAFVALLNMYPASFEEAKPFLKKNPYLAVSLVEEFHKDPVSAAFIKGAVQFFEHRWLLDLSSLALKRLVSLEKGQELMADLLLQELGDNAACWEIFTQLTTTSSLKEAVSSAKLLGSS